MGTVLHQCFIDWTPTVHSSVQLSPCCTLLYPWSLLNEWSSYMHCCSSVFWDRALIFRGPCKSTYCAVTIRPCWDNTRWWIKLFVLCFSEANSELLSHSEYCLLLSNGFQIAPSFCFQVLFHRKIRHVVKVIRNNFFLYTNCWNNFISGL